jgi:hypothetical protein
MSKRLEECYFFVFQQYGIHVVIDLVRCQKGKNTDEDNIFEESYESFIEISIEKDEDYYPNAYIPIWKCQRDMFSLIGYVTKWNIKEIERKVTRILQEMLAEARVSANKR